MNIYTKKAQTPGISIVPMLDILTILLIFFIVHTEFKRQINVLPMQLPQTQHLAGETGSAEDLLLEVGADGSLAFAGKAVSPAELADIIRQQHPQNIQVCAADGASMGQFMEVMDILNESGMNIEEIPVRIDYKP